MMKTFGERIRNEREKRGWSQVYVADRLGLKRSATYANWEYDLRSADHEMIVKLADLFEVTTDWLLGRSRNPHRTEAQDIEDSLEELKRLRDRFANNEVPGVSPERSARLVESIDMQLRAIEDEKQK